MAERARLLMCPPDHFGVDYVINPWMRGHVGSAEPDRADAQWRALHAAFCACADVELLPAAPGLPDLVFTANAGLVLGDRFVPSRFRHAERRGEEAHDRAWFDAHGFQTHPLDGDIAFEGAGDALFDRAAARLWFGYGHRSDAAAVPGLADALDVEVTPLRLVDPRFYHLDTCFCPLAGGHVLYFPPAFDAAARAAIEARVAPPLRISVDEADALAFACNAVNIGKTVVMNRATPALRARLAGSGFDVIEADVSEFMKAGGAVKCLTLRLDEARIGAGSVLPDQATASARRAGAGAG